MCAMGGRDMDEFICEALAKKQKANGDHGQDKKEATVEQEAK